MSRNNAGLIEEKDLGLRAMPTVVPAAATCYFTPIPIFEFFVLYYQSYTTSALRFACDRRRVHLSAVSGDFIAVALKEER